jgi:DNA polymerase III subunit delta'
VTPAATWAAVEGEPAVVATVRAALEHDEVAHAWLLVGPAGVGQAQVAAALAAALNCEASDDPTEGCGACVTCQRIARGTYSALQEFAPEGQFHVVSSVREEWIPTASRTLTEGRRRVLRVLQADRMNEAAQNAFLKILEEPPPSVVWLLEATDESMLLDTIVSRCRRLDLVPWPPAALEGHAEALGIPPERRGALARAAMGSPDRLAELADTELAEARARDLALVDRLTVEGPGRVVPIARELVGWAKSRVEPLKAQHEAAMAELEEQFGASGNPRAWPPGVKQRIQKRHHRLERQEQRRVLTTVLDDVASYLRDCLAVGAGADETTVVNVDHLDELARDAQRLGPAAAIEGLQAIERCREALERNGQAELQLERLLLALALPLFRAA